MIKLRAIPTAVVSRKPKRNRTTTVRVLSHL